MTTSLTIRPTMLLLLAAFSLPASAAPVPMPGARAVGADTIVYRVVKNDNLYTLAARFFRRVSDAETVRRLNRIENPNRLSIGRSLRIPRSLLRFTPLRAKVVAFHGPVTLRVGANELAAAVGMEVGEGDRIATGTNGFISLRLPDRSTISLPSKSEIAIRRLRRLALLNGLERLFAIETGRARAVVTPMDRNRDDFRFSTPAAVSAVRGTEFQMAYSEDQTTVEVLHGLVGLSPRTGGDKTDIAAGFGALARAGETPRSFALLPAPSLERAGKIQNTENLDFVVRPLEGASAYRAQIARDAGFIDTFSETISTDLKLSLPPIPDGTWFVRVVGIDANRLEGVPATFSFQRRLGPNTSVEGRKVGGAREYLFGWIPTASDKGFYRFQLSIDAEGAIPMIDEAGLTRPEFIVTDLPPGQYRWRVMSTDIDDGRMLREWSPMERLTVSDER